MLRYLQQRINAPQCASLQSVVYTSGLCLQRHRQRAVHFLRCQDCRIRTRYAVIISCGFQPGSCREPNRAPNAVERMLLPQSWLEPVIIAACVLFTWPAQADVTNFPVRWDYLTKLLGVRILSLTLHSWPLVYRKAVLDYSTCMLQADRDIDHCHCGQSVAGELAHGRSGIQARLWANEGSGHKAVGTVHMSHTHSISSRSKIELLDV